MNIERNRKIKVTETVLRDGQQSLMATRMSISDMLPIIETMDQVGYESVECWGGATFDVCMKYLNENPWERLRALRRGFQKTKLQMLLRGQNLLGYRHYSDDVVDSFIGQSVENGIDIFRIFDAFNDVRNLERAAGSAKKEGAHVQLAMAYTVGNAYTMEYWKDLAESLVQIGADSICIKDMAGLLRPNYTAELVKMLKQTVSVPITIHSHCTSGMAPTAYLKAVEAGCDGIDTAISPFSMGTSQPATEVINEVLKEQGIDTNLNEEALQEVAKHFRQIRRQAEEQQLIDVKTMDIDTEVLNYQIPGGMLSNLLMQMKEQNLQDRFEEVIQEIPRVREELGEPPLVTPSSQIIGTQAVFNVVTGERYKMVSNQTKSILKGEYGRTARPFDDALQKKVIGTDSIISCRPADLLQPELSQAKKTMELKAGSDEDLLSYILFPQTAGPYLEKQRM